MKVYIGPYINFFGPYQLTSYLKYIGVPKSYRERLSEMIPIEPFEWFDKHFRQRNIKIRIDNYDTWGMYETLALIILPMLKQLKETKHGSPFVDDEDVPVDIKSTSAPPKENEWDTDEHFFSRWEYVLNEMIFAFEHIVDDDWEEQFYTGETDFLFVPIDPNDPEKRNTLAHGPNHTFHVNQDGIKAVHDRINNGIRLFGKYYLNLWD